MDSNPNINEVVERAKGIADVSTNKELAKLLDISDKNFSNMKSRGSLLSLLIDWAINREVDLNQFIYGEKKTNSTNTPSSPNNFSSIPLVDVQLSAGNGSFVNSEEVKEYYQFRKDWLNRTVTSSPNAILVGVTGNSMEPTIYNGDVVMIDTGRTHIYEGEMYALRMDNTVMIKRLSHRPGDKVMIMSDNKEEYESYETKRKNIHVLAQVVWYARTLVKTDVFK